MHWAIILQVALVASLISLMVFAWVLGGGTRLAMCATFVLDKVALGLDPVLMLFTRDTITQDCQCVWVMSYARPDFHYWHLLHTHTQTWRYLKVLILTWSRKLVYPPSQKCYLRTSCLCRAVATSSGFNWTTVSCTHYYWWHYRQTGRQLRVQLSSFKVDVKMAVNGVKVSPPGLPDKPHHPKHFSSPSEWLGKPNSDNVHYAFT